MSKYRNQLETYLGSLEVKADRVIDVGGAAFPVRNRVSSWDVKTYHICDNGLEGGEGITDFFLDLNLTQKPDCEPYDWVFCLEVMEYVYDPITAIVNLNYLCKPGGKLIISFPFIYPLHQPIIADTLRYTPLGAVRLLNNGGFDVQKSVSRTDVSGRLVEFYQADGMHIAGNANTTGVIIEAIK